MTSWQIIVATVLVIFSIAAPLAWVFWKRWRPRPDLERAKRRFQLRREWLEAKFFSLASESGSPRGLEWVDCEFDDGVSFARDRHSGQLRALVAVTIRFRAVEGGGMEDNPNVNNLRAASAVFHFENGEWMSLGRVLFNLNPHEAIERLNQELEVAE